MVSSTLFQYAGFDMFVTSATHLLSVCYRYVTMHVCYKLSWAECPHMAYFEILMCFAYIIQKCGRVWKWQNYYHCKKHLGYSYHIFKLSQLHQCDQEMLPIGFLESSLKSFFFGYISSYSLPSEDLFGYILGISTTSTQTRNSLEVDV